MNNHTAQILIDGALLLGATRASVIEANKVCCDAGFRDMCKSNACGRYGKCWTCPPACGEIDLLIGSLCEYEWVLVFQTVGKLEDSFDFESMMEHQKAHNRLTDGIREKFGGELGKFLLLGAGGCGICPKCAKQDEEPCRFPDRAISSLEAYGINVSKLAVSAGMNYINGKDTVTYFGALFFKE